MPGSCEDAVVDAIGWIITAVAAGIAVAAVALAPRLRRDNLRRQAEGGGGSFAGVGAGLDAVWRPSADEARAGWEAQVEMPAPAPTPGDKGRMEDGRIVIEVD
jgi:hypothetical protein